MDGLHFKIDLVRSQIIAVMNGESVIFDASYYSRYAVDNERMLSALPYDEVNHWLASVEVSRQKQLFELLKQCRFDIDDEPDEEKMLDKLNNNYIKLYSIIEAQEIKRWLFSGKVFISSAPNTPLRNTPKETTYTYDEYLDLVAHVMLLRFITPVWGDISHRLNTRYGKDYSEIYAMEILHSTPLEHAEPALRLRTFMQYIDDMSDSNEVLMSGLSQEDFNNHLFAVVCTRRLALGKLTNHNGAYTLVTSVYKFLNSRVHQLVKGLGDGKQTIVERRKPTDMIGGSEATNQSVVDMTFSRTSISADNKAFLVHAARDHKRLIETVEPELPMEMFWDCLEKVRSSAHFRPSSDYMRPIQEVQIDLTKWVLADTLNPAVYDHLGLEDLRDLTAVAASILWYRGYYEFAAIITAQAMGMESSMPMVASTHRKNIDSSVSLELNKRFDYAVNSKAKGKSMTPRECIVHFDNAFTRYNWSLNLPDEWLEENKVRHTNGVMLLQPDISTRLGKLMLDIESRQELQTNLDNDIEW